jgi:glyoxylase-like metal-dependent hydrolase (beta-lactamase superfamily II)
MGQRVALPAGLPVLAPCALVHLEVDDDLSNGARRWFRGDWKVAYTTFLLRHPKGVVLIDAAFGDTVNADLEAAPWWFRWQFGAARKARPLSQLLVEAGVKPEDVTLVLLTHAHWDHAGGLAQLPNAKVAMSAAEADWILNAQGALDGLAVPHHFAKANVQRVQFDGPPYDAFAASHDLFGDGSIVAVPTAGHTRGATSWYVNSGDGKRWLFIGDAAWVKEGFEEPATKGRMASLFADWDRAQTSESLGLLHAVHAAGAATLVTSHDARTWINVPRCPSTSPGARPSSASP